MSLPVGRQAFQRAVWRLLRVSRTRHISTSCRHLQADIVDRSASPSKPLPGPSQPRSPPHNRLKNAIDVELAVSVPGATSQLSPILLRDLCSCPHCIDPSTKQKHFSTADIPEDIQARSVLADTEKLTIQWTNDISNYGEDHTTEVSKEQIRQVLGTKTAREPLEPVPRSLWDSDMFQSGTTDFSYDEYMQDDSVLLKALRQLHSHGLLFVTGVPEDEKSVETVAERIGPLKTTFYGRTWDVRSVPDAINVAYTAQNLGFHMDLMYMEQPPHLQLLHCIRSSAAGGASLFTDSFRAVDDLAHEDATAFGTLGVVKANFHYDHPGSHYYHRARPVIAQRKVQMSAKSSVWPHRLLGKQGLGSINIVDHIDSVAWSPPFQAPFGSMNGYRPTTAKMLSANVNKWHSAAAKFNSLIHRPEMIHERMMKPGELVLFDNRRVLHARRAFEVGDAGKERWLRGAYIDRDPYLSRLRVLRETLERGPTSS